MAQWLVVPCPVCRGIIELEHPAGGQEVECSDCGQLFRIATLEPLELVYARDIDDEGEDYDEDRARTQS